MVDLKFGKATKLSMARFMFSLSRTQPPKSMFEDSEGMGAGDEEVHAGVGGIAPRPDKVENATI